MTYRVNQFVEVSLLHLPCLRWLPASLTLSFNTTQVEGDQNDPGFRDSWSKYKVLTAPRHGRVRVQSLEVWLVCDVHRTVLPTAVVVPLILMSMCLCITVLSRGCYQWGAACRGEAA